MALSQAVLNDFKLNCSTVDGNIPGQFRLDFVEIDYGDRKHPITDYTSGIYIFEDIDVAGVSGWLELSDVDNLISAYYEEKEKGVGGHAIVGQELLRLKFRTNGSHLPIDFQNHPLCIHKIENLTSTGTGSSSLAINYRLHFCSPEVLNNDRVRVSQSYEDTLENIVKSILNDHLKTSKDIWLEPTDGVWKITIPNMHPFEAIQMLLQQARSKDRIWANFNFYETTKGWRFKSKYIGHDSSRDRTASHHGGMDSLNDDWQLRIGIEPTATSGTYYSDMLTAKSYRFKKIGDTYTAIKDGMLASKTIQHNSYNKGYNIKGATYLTDPKEMPAVQRLPGIENQRLNHYVRGKASTFINEGEVYVSDGTKFATQTPFLKSETFTEFPDGRINFYSTGTKHTHDHLPDPHGAGGKVTTGSIIDEDPLQFNFRQMQQRHDRYLQIQIVIHGFSGLQVGDSISLDIPIVGSQAQSEGHAWDPRFSSDTFYITRLVHRINVDQPNGYECVLDVCPMKGGRDPTPAGGDHKGKKDKGSQRIINRRRQRERNQEAD